MDPGTSVPITIGQRWTRKRDGAEFFVRAVHNSAVGISRSVDDGITSWSWPWESQLRDRYELTQDATFHENSSPRR